MTWMVGQSMPSAHLQVMQNSEDWLKDQTCVLLFRETLTCQQMDQWEPHEVQEREMQNQHLGRKNPMHQCTLCTHNLESSFAEKELKFLLDKEVQWYLGIN